MGEEPDIHELEKQVKAFEDLNLPHPDDLTPSGLGEDSTSLENAVYQQSYLSGRKIVENDYLLKVGKKLDDELAFTKVALEQSDEEKEVLRDKATYDSLTGLFNRDAFWEAVDEKAGQVRRSSDRSRSHRIVRLDLDEFKELNDSYGHRRGDDILEGVGRILQNHVRKGFAGRLGGDEFGIFLEDTGDEEAEKVLRDIKYRINAMKVKGVTRPVGVSIGVAPYEQASDMYEADHNADSAAYASKQNGRNAIVFFNPDKHELSPHGDRHRRSDDR